MSETLLVIDTETGGLDSTRHSILSIGAVVYRRGQLGDKIELIISEQNLSVEDDAMRVNKIDVQSLSKVGFTPQIAVAKFEDFLSSHFEPSRRITLVGHNVSFDIGFLKRLYRLAGADFERRFSHRSIDTASILSYLRLAGKITLSKSGLDAALVHFGVEVRAERRHTALVDAEATAELLDALIFFIK